MKKSAFSLGIAIIILMVHGTHDGVMVFAESAGPELGWSSAASEGESTEHVFFSLPERQVTISLTRADQVCNVIEKNKAAEKEKGPWERETLTNDFSRLSFFPLPRRNDHDELWGDGMRLSRVLLKGTAKRWSATLQNGYDPPSS